MRIDKLSRYDTKFKSVIVRVTKREDTKELIVLIYGLEKGDKLFP